MSLPNENCPCPLSCRHDVECHGYCRISQPVASEPSSGERAELITPRGWLFERIDADQIKISWDGSGLVVGSDGSGASGVAGVALYALAADLLSSDAKPASELETWEGGEGWESLAWELCADENGEDACNELVWEGGPIPEPWGDRWMKYEGEAKRLIALVQKHTAHKASEPVAVMPPWMNYDTASDVLTIHGKRYSAKMFGEEGFLGEPGELLRIERGQNEVVTLLKVNEPIAVPQGMKLVPVEPTEEMLLEGQYAIETARCRTSEAPAVAYRAMLSAANSPAPVGTTPPPVSMGEIYHSFAEDLRD